MNSCSLSIGSESWLYQEAADEIGYRNYYFDFNYTRPANSTTGSLWLVKHGVAPDYNVSIPEDCFHSSKLDFEFFSDGDNFHSTYHSYGSCKDDQGTLTRITNDSTASRVPGDGCSTNSVGRAYDGSWSTEITYCSANWRTAFGNGRYGVLYEEAMWWQIVNYSDHTMNINNAGTSTTSTVSVSGLENGKVYQYSVSCENLIGLDTNSEVRTFTVNTG